MHYSVLSGIIILFILIILIMIWMHIDKPETMAPVAKFCEKHKKQKQELDIFERYPYIEYEEPCKWRRFDNLLVVNQ